MNLLELGRLGVDQMDHFHLVTGKDRVFNLTQLEGLFVDHADLLYVSDSQGWLDEIVGELRLKSNTLVTKHIDEISLTECSNYKTVVLDVTDKRYVLEAISYLKTAREGERCELVVVYTHPNLPDTSVLIVSTR